MPKKKIFALSFFLSLSSSNGDIFSIEICLIPSIFIPGYIDFLEIENITRFIGGVNKTIPYRIDAYIPVGDNPWRRPTPEEMEEAVSAAGRYLVNVSCLKGNEDLKFEVLRIF